MKALSRTFAVLAILLSDVMCAAVAFNYCDMLWGIRYASYLSLIHISEPTRH